MSALFDRWPWSLPPGPTFFWLYLVTGTLALGVVAAAQRLLCAWLDARRAPAKRAVAGPGGRGVAEAGVTPD